MVDEWYNYSKFSFKRDEILWALCNAELLRSGKWPPQNIESGYVDPTLRRKGVKREPAFVKPVVIIGEIDWRLEHTGQNGLHTDAKLLLAEVDAGYELFSDEAWNVLNFLSGWRRRRQSYNQWKADRKYKKAIKT